MIHNEMSKVPAKGTVAPAAYERALRGARGMQTSLDAQGLIQALLPNLKRDNFRITREVFNLLNLVYKGNADTPETFVTHVAVSHHSSTHIRSPKHSNSL